MKNSWTNKLLRSEKLLNQIFRSDSQYLAIKYVWTVFVYEPTLFHSVLFASHGFGRFQESWRWIDRQCGKRRTLLATKRCQAKSREIRVHLPGVQVRLQLCWLIYLIDRTDVYTRSYSDIVKAAHLRPLSKKEIECKSNSSVVWNNVAHNMQDSKQSADFVSDILCQIMYVPSVYLHQVIFFLDPRCWH